MIANVMSRNANDVEQRGSSSSSGGGGVEGAGVCCVFILCSAVVGKSDAERVQGPQRD